MSFLKIPGENTINTGAQCGTINCSDNSVAQCQENNKTFQTNFTSGQQNATSYETVKATQSTTS